MLQKKLIFLGVLGCFMVALWATPRPLRASTSCLTECLDQESACIQNCKGPNGVPQCIAACEAQFRECEANCS
jgi:hypothetical protein